LFIAGSGLKAPAAAAGGRAAVKARFTRVAEALRAEARSVEDGVEKLAAAARAALARHREALPQRELVLARLADCAIDLYATSASIARTTALIAQRGADGAAREIDLTRLFAAAAGRRIAEQWKAVESNEDDVVRRISERTCAET